MLTFLVLTAVTFSLFGYHRNLGRRFRKVADGFRMLVVTPLTFLGGEAFRNICCPRAGAPSPLLNPVVYLISGFRWSFTKSPTSAWASASASRCFFSPSAWSRWWIFKTGYSAEKSDAKRHSVTLGRSKTRTRNLNKTYR